MSKYNFSKFKFFFINHSIKVPYLLNKVKSIKRLKKQTDLTELSQFLIKKGKKLKAISLLQSFYKNYLNFIKDKVNLNNLYSWKSLYFLFSTYFSNNYSIINLTKLKNSSLLLTKPQSKFNLLVSESFKKINIIFSFYIYKVDKAIYKNSRGKSGKYTFIWKYVPLYKRNRLINYWIYKEIKIQSGKNLNARITTIFLNLFNNITSTWIWKIKKFALNYIYYKLRKSLAETYKTSKK